MLHFRQVFRRREQEQNGVQIAFFWHDTIIAQEVSQNGGRHAEVFVFACLHIDTRCGQQQFARVDKILVLSITREGVPACIGLEFEETQIFGDGFSVG